MTCDHFSSIWKKKTGKRIQASWPLQAKDLAKLQALCPHVVQLPLEIPAAASSSVRHHPSPELVPSELLTDLAQQNLYGFSTDDLPCADRTDPIQPAGR